MMLGPINRADIGVTNREYHARDVVAIDIHRGVEAEGVVMGNAFPFAAKAVPEVYKCLGQVSRLWPNDPQMRVAPLRGVEGTHVVTTDKRSSTIDDQQLAVIQAVAPGIEQMPGTTNRPEREHVHGRREALEGARYDQVAERVVDDVDGDSFFRLRGEQIFEVPSNRIILPEICLEVDALAGVYNRIEHGIVEMLAITEYLQAIVARGHLRQAQVREATVRETLHAPSRNEGK